MPNSINLTQFNEHMQQAKALQKQFDEAKAAQETHFTKASYELEKIIEDKSIPVIDRWEFYQDAPTNLKRHLPSLCIAKSRSLQSVIEKHLENSGRNTTLDTSELLDGAEEDLRTNPDAPFWWDKSTRVADALEEVMGKNIGSFVLSW